MERVQPETEKKTVRFRLDKTVPAGLTVSGRLCNLDCIWCHHDYFDHSGTHRCAISNQMFAYGVAKVIEAAKVEEAVVRIGGDGEPTMVGDRELIELIEMLRQIPQVKSIRITTNGIKFGVMVHSLKQAGLDGVTVSLNSLDPEIYHFYSGRHCLGEVLESIRVSLSEGFATKVNVIYCRLNARELRDYLDLVQQNVGLIVKFFDLIPTQQLDRRLYLPLHQLEECLAPYAHDVKDLGGAYSYREYTLIGGGIVQVKTAQDNNCPNLSCSVRANCLEGCRSSVRIRFDGVLQPCGIRTDNTIDLFAPQTTQTQLRRALRSGGKL